MSQILCEQEVNINSTVLFAMMAYFLAEHVRIPGAYLSAFI